LPHHQLDVFDILDAGARVTFDRDQIGVSVNPSHLDNAIRMYG
jgi:hypothetical protein